MALLEAFACTHVIYVNVRGIVSVPLCLCLQYKYFKMIASSNEDFKVFITFLCHFEHETKFNKQQLQLSAYRNIDLN